MLLVMSTQSLTTPLPLLAKVLCISTPSRLSLKGSVPSSLWSETMLGVCPPYMETSSCNKGEDWLNYLQMSSQLTMLVQTFDGSNYQLWSKAMKAWLQSQGLWGFVDRTIVHPADPAAGAATAEIAAAEAAIAAWVRSNDMAMGNLVLRLNPSIQESLGAFTAAEAVWDDLRDRYGAATIPQVYKDFKEVIDICINPNTHPSVQLDHMAAAFQRLSHIAVGTAPNVTHLSLSSQMQVMIALAALPLQMGTPHPYHY